MIVLLASAGCAGGPGPTTPSPDRSVDHVLAALQQAVTGHDPSSAAALAAPGDAQAAAQLSLMAENAATAELTGVSFHVDRDDRVRHVVGRWSQPVVTTWRIRGFDRAPARAAIRFDFTLSGDRVTISGVGGHPGPTPLWVSTRLSAWKAPGVLLLTPTEPADRGTEVLRQAARGAVRTVARAVPGWERRLVVEVAPTRTAFAAAVGGPPERYAALAALTATSDASGAARAPEHVFVNPDRFDGLTPRSAAVVLAHETTHVALSAAVGRMPLWLVEGWADHVALAGRPGARRAVEHRLGRWTAQRGLPEELPPDQAFAATGAALEHAYESSWAACAALTSLVGEGRGLAVYRAVSDGASLDHALRDVGLTRGDLLRQWLVRLSGSAM